MCFPSFLGAAAGVRGFQSLNLQSAQPLCPHSLSKEVWKKKNECALSLVSGSSKNSRENTSPP